MSEDFLKQLVLDKRKENKVVYWALPDELCSADIADFIKQPADGILWDLNRLEECALSMTDNQRWVNDFAVALTIRALKQSVEKLEEDYVMLQKGLCGTNAELSNAWATAEKAEERIAELKTKLDDCRKLAHSYIKAYEKLAFSDAVVEDYPNEWPEDAEDGKKNVERT